MSGKLKALVLAIAAVVQLGLVVAVGTGVLMNSDIQP